MTARRYKFTIVALVLALIAAIVIPLVRGNQLPRLSLADDSQLVIGCTTKLTVELQDQRATLRCAAPGDLAIGSAQQAVPTIMPGAPAAATPSAPATATPAAPEPARAAKPIFEDQLDATWSNWSWGSTIDVAAKTAHAGSAAIGVTYTAGWSGLYIHPNQPLDSSGYDTLRFWANGSSAGGQQIRVCFISSCDRVSAVYTLEANTWKSYDIPLGDVGAASALNDLIWQNATAGGQPIFFLDDIALIATRRAQSSGAAPASPAGSGPALAVDAGADRHAISPLIYGMNFPDAALLKDLGLTVQRWGGNATTRYNWQNDTSNHASDWFFENIPNENADVAALPNGSSSDKFVDQGRQAGIQTILTIPLIGWTPKTRAITCGFASAKYAQQQKADAAHGCGNGNTPDGKSIIGNDPNDTSQPITPDFVGDWVRHLVKQYGSGEKRGVAFYNLDNEPFLWHTTHRDVHPDPVSYDELRDRTYQYAAALKQADPSAKTLGPGEWGWTGYFYSAKDQADGGSWWSSAPDRKAHGDTPFIEWYLDQMRDYEQQHGVRILDYLDLHYYPQAQGIALQGAGDADTQALRLRSTRSLWDASYKDESWIGEPVRLIPRMQEWAARYPGTKTALSEYNWGALDSMNGALAQADALGIFGRERLDLATLWAPPKASQPGAYAFRMFRNYDGKGAAFGDTSLRATSDDPDKLAIYAAERGDTTLTLMVINKSNQDLASAIALQHVSVQDSAQIYRYSAAKLDAIERGDDIKIVNDQISTSFPANSITLIELPHR
jgi:hypothetical protein